MKIIIGILFSPMAFAPGFLWPLATQLTISLQLAAPGSSAIIVGAVVAGTLGLLAQFRGSWLWIK